MDTSERMRMFVEMTGLSQTDIVKRCAPYAKQLGVKFTKSALSQYLSGKKTPKLDKLKVLEKAFGFSAEWLAGYTDDPAPKQHKDDGIQRLYDQLNTTGKKKVTDYIVDLLETQKYRKEDDNAPD